MSDSANLGHSAGSLRAVRVRQVAVTAAEIFCVVGTLYGTGVIGTRVEESSGGRLAADATLIAPAGPAFSSAAAPVIARVGSTPSGSVAPEMAATSPKSSEVAMGKN